MGVTYSLEDREMLAVLSSLGIAYAVRLLSSRQDARGRRDSPYDGRYHIAHRACVLENNHCPGDSKDGQKMMRDPRLVSLELLNELRVDLA